MSSISKREEVLEGKIVAESLKEVDYKQLIRLLAGGIGGIEIARFVLKNSSKVDTLVFKALPAYLKRYDFCFLGYLGVPIPNWFSATVMLGLIVGTLAEVKIKRNEMLERERRR